MCAKSKLLDVDRMESVLDALKYNGIEEYTFIMQNTRENALDSFIEKSPSLSLKQNFMYYLMLKKGGINEVNNPMVLR